MQKQTSNPKWHIFYSRKGIIGRNVQVDCSWWSLYSAVRLIKLWLHGVQPTNIYYSPLVIDSISSSYNGIEHIAVQKHQTTKDMRVVRTESKVMVVWQGSIDRNRTDQLKIFFYWNKLSMGVTRILNMKTLTLLAADDDKIWMHLRGKGLTVLVPFFRILQLRYHVEVENIGEVYVIQLFFIDSKKWMIQVFRLRGDVVNFRLKQIGIRRN